MTASKQPDAASAEAEAPARRLPLEGVRVLAQAIVWAGPFATVLLSDLGAEVIEVESIQHLNPTRTNSRHVSPVMLAGTTGTYYLDRDGSEGFWNRQAWYNYGKRGCKSITLDLRRERGRELFYELVKHSDAFIENGAADVVDNLAIGWETLSAINPELVMVRFPGFGISGPYAHYKGYGNIMEAVVGHTMLRGYADADPSLTPASLHGDPNAGATVAFALQAALWARKRTGRGQLIEISQAEAVMQHLSYAFMDYSMNGRAHGHAGNTHPSIAPYGIFACAPSPSPAGDEDAADRWIAIATPSDEAFAALCGEMGRPELAADERYADIVSRHRNRAELEAEIRAWTAGHEAQPLMQQLQRAGVPAVALLHQPEMTGDPQLVERGFFQEITHPAAGTHDYPGPMAQFSRTPLTPVRGPAPLLGQHNEELLRGLIGLSEAEYEQLVEDRIVGTAYLEDAT